MITVIVPDEPVINRTTGFGRLRARSVKQTKTSVTLQWNIIKDADGYFIIRKSLQYQHKNPQIQKNCHHHQRRYRHMDTEAVAEQIEKIHAEYASVIQYNNENSLSSVLSIAY